MDSGGLDGRGIGEVDVGHDDQTTLKSGLHFFEQFTLTANRLTSSLHPLLSYIRFQSFTFTKWFYVGNGFNHMKVFEDVIFITALIHPPS